MDVNVLVSKEASEVLGRLSADQRERLLSGLDQLSGGIPATAVPVAPGTDRPLYAAGLGGRWRVIFSADQPVRQITVLKVFEMESAIQANRAVTAHS